MRLIGRIRKLERRDPDIDYVAEARKFVDWIMENNLMTSTGGKNQRMKEQQMPGPEGESFGSVQQ